MNISEKYAAQLKELHNQNSEFGKGSVTSKHYPTIDQFIEKKDMKRVLDYGCGKGDLVHRLRNKYSDITVDGYDVASEEFATHPEKKYDLVLCLDVLEHVEFGALSNVLSDIKESTEKLFICSIANYPAAKKLQDGRNAHITQLPFGTWFTVLSGFFRVDKFNRTGRAEGLFFCTPLVVSSDWR